MRGNIDERGKKLFIGGLHLKTTEDSLKAFYSQWGELIDVVVMRDPQSGKSRGFGFVTYSDSSSVDEAQSNRPHEIDGIKVDAKRAMPKEDTSPEFHATVNRLFVGRLKRTATVDDLRAYFGQYGVISDAVIINSPTGESRGFGFVTFEDTDSVDKIIVSRPHEIDGQNLEVKKALPRGEDSRSGRGGQGSNRSSRGNNSNSRGGFSSNVTPRGNYNSNAGPRGGFSNSMNSSFNQRFEDDNDNFGNYTNSSSNFRNPYNASTNTPYSQNYNSAANIPYQQNYSANSNPQYQQNYNNIPNKAALTNPTYSDQQFDPSYGQQPAYDSDAGFSSFNQYNASAAPPSRPYGYPPYGSGGRGGGAGYMGDYSNQKPAGGPIRGGSNATFGRGGGGQRYGTGPY